MKRILLALFCLLAFPVMASHIVGGEFELLYIGNYQYRLNLVYYFDLNNNNFTNPPTPPQNAVPEDSEPTIEIAIFRKGDNALMRYVTLTFLSRTRVSYTQPACSNGEILTDKLIYTTVITLPPEQYSNAAGYYLVWERCCRNYAITNIISEEPPPLTPDYPNAAGQSFYLEFPPVAKNGQPFVNSSPKLFPPLNDYACPGKPYYADFAGTDDDGDSLVYSLVTPLSTHNSLASPGLQPAPFPEVRWQEPFNFNNIIGGSPDLKISKDGFLTVTPGPQGLFVFAVKCEEYRNRKKIGEVRRDFQMLVVDQCEHAEPPKVMGKKLTDAGFTFEDEMQITFTNDVSNENRCIQVQVSDPDASNMLDGFRENITLKAVGLNFKNTTGISFNETATILTNGSTYNFTVCFDKCPPFEGGPFQVGIVAYDDACSLPLSDTLKVTVNIEPPDNTKPKFFVNGNSITTLTTTLPAGSAKQTWVIEAVDNDRDENFPDLFEHVNIFVLPEPGFDFFGAGMDFQPLGQAGNTAKAEFSWDPDCSFPEFARKTEFNIRFLAEDEDGCEITDPDTVDFKLIIQLPADSDPLITTDLPEELRQNGITKKVFESVEFNVTGSDPDNYIIKLKGKGEDFEMNNYGIDFQPVSGFNSVTSHFKWDLTCEKLNLSQKSEFDFQFIVVDSANQCLIYKADTLNVKVKVEPPDNQKPLLSVINTNENLTFENNQQSLLAGDQISLALVSVDGDITPQDDVFIEMVGATGNVEPTGFEFARAEGTGTAQTTFTWNTDCSIFNGGLYENNYTFTFMTKDNRCFASKTDTVEVDFIITDREVNNVDFIPPNLVTYNGDQKNDFFAMMRENQDTKELESILPLDNCVGRFVNIRIYNRWGMQVFESFSRDFKWIPDNEAAGIYFYTLTYSNKEYKGSVTVQN